MSFWYYKMQSKKKRNKKRPLRTISGLVFMLFEGTGCRTIENKCSLFARHITKNWQDISLPDL